MVYLALVCSSLMVSVRFRSKIFLKFSCLEDDWIMEALYWSPMSLVEYTLCFYRWMRYWVVGLGQRRWIIGNSTWTCVYYPLSFLFLLPGYHGVISFPLPGPSLMLSVYGLTLLKLWDKINLISLSCRCWVLCPTAKEYSKWCWQVLPHFVHFLMTYHVYAFLAEMSFVHYLKLYFMEKKVRKKFIKIIGKKQ